ncbi:pyruvate carboxylase [Anaerobranca californiensis DSM 14826]|jgi:pyruvate carboxylase|uniref:Pyruvate carboxylase n=1 Tax=Anaerobranca californiensis DSM 14826 TaxID=1120989 RepID=A0A1M6MTY9_9FIRM|nr:pyruvate carboxylase [Anaerobranca californiensis]SHJ86941.1 pyruvate carboxylase [Anaerobranca californiensis DSM 14826]
MEIKKFKRVLVANRGEIAIRIFRACKELGIRTVAIYSEEDKTSLFRTKADESYLIGKNKGPIEAYLSIDEIINLALKKGVDAIHPGYGFLAENPEFAKKCLDANLEFIGPSVEVLEKMGDKITSKQVAANAQVPVIPGIDRPIQRLEEALDFVKTYGFPIIIKAAFGGGGRGMRIVRNEDELVLALDRAKSEARKAFGVEDVFIEKYLESPKHIEVQILGDKYGNIIHLYERDCSIQRRHQKLIEYAPAFSLPTTLRERICQDALKLAKSVNYSNAGTVEFLVDQWGKHYFIEMNPRIQVEHTVTEVVTGIDIVQSQILISQGYPLDSEEIKISGQQDIKVNGYAIQSRITTEDPAQNFAPDTGKIDIYRTSSGFGIRLDGGNGFTGSIITPYYDSLLVKVTSFSRTFEDATKKGVRALKEMNISGVKTNIPFLINVLTHETFLKGMATTNFINENPELFNIKPKSNKELKLLNFIGEKIIQTKGQKENFDVPIIPKVQLPNNLYGTKQILEKNGPKGVVKWIKNQRKLLITDTTMRDAHQSLIATRLRTRDMVNIAPATSVYGKDLFSLEMWGGATFDVAYRFLKECPWQRLEELRKRIPNIMFQMLLRGSNAVGYKNYPDNVIRSFIKEAKKSGIDIFRIFDSLNWLKGIEVALDEVLLNNGLAEVCICYTGDILDKDRDKYSLNYYIKKAKEIEKMGAHILCIKDMAGLLKPYAAYKLISALKQEVELPIHLHTHDTSGNGVATLLMAAEAGVDIVDTAFNSFSGLTSQPSMNSVVAALENTPRETGLNLDYLEEISQYWEAVRQVYYPFESDLKSGTTEVYKYEIPGGQYSNLKPQVESFGLGHRFKEVKEMYKRVNQMLGDIVKVTPSSKMVGDMAIFMVQNNLTPENILTQGKGLNFPDSVVDYFKGLMGHPEGGFPKELQALVLKGEKPITKRPGEILEPEDFQKIALYLKEKHNIEPTEKDLLSYALYPKVFDEYLQYIKEKGDFSRMGSDIFFHGLAEGETCEVEIADGKVLVVKLLEIGRLDSEGNITLSFEINGQRRDILVKNKEFKREENENNKVAMADLKNIKEIPASIPGVVLKILVNPGDNVTKNQPIIVLEAMKMETVIVAPLNGIVDAIFVKEKQNVKSGQLLLRLK